jgi:hypothetical protein
MSRTLAKLEAQAKRTAIEAIKGRASAYATQPRHLDAIVDGLSSFAPKPMVQIMSIICRNAHTYRHVGSGGEVPAINLRGAMLYARWSRYVESRSR